MIAVAPGSTTIGPGLASTSTTLDIRAIPDLRSRRSVDRR
jgi:hypothetical protein